MPNSLNDNSRADLSYEIELRLDGAIAYGIRQGTGTEADPIHISLDLGSFGAVDVNIPLEGDVVRVITDHVIDSYDEPYEVEELIDELIESRQRLISSGLWRESFGVGIRTQESMADWPYRPLGPSSRFEEEGESSPRTCCYYCKGEASRKDRCTCRSTQYHGAKLLYKEGVVVV